MATRDELYCKFGLAAEAGQLFETELGTLLLMARGLSGRWHLAPDVEAGRKLLKEIDSHTLGRLLGRVKDMISFDDHLEAQFQAALNARNRLNHGFFEEHNFRIQTDDGRDLMVEDLETLHAELFEAWQVVSSITKVVMEVLLQQQGHRGDAT